MYRPRGRYPKLIRRQAEQLRHQLGELGLVHSNGRRSSRGLRPRRRRRRPWTVRGFCRRALLLIFSAAVFFGVVGSRACFNPEALTPAQKARARIEIYIACHINDCTPEQLRALLHQLDNYPTNEEEERRP